MPKTIPRNNTSPWRSYVEAIALAFIVISSATAGYLIGGIR